MADSHGSHDSHDTSGHHAHPEPAEDSIRTPGWVPLVGLALLLLGTLWTYLYISPGVWSPAADGGADASAEAAAP